MDSQPATHNAGQWHFRGYREDDIPALALLINAADRADQSYKHTSEEDLRDTFETPGLEPSRQVIVVDGPPVPGVREGMLLGFGRAFPSHDRSRNERIYSLALRAHPETRALGLEHEIAKRLVGLAQQHEAEVGGSATGRARLRTFLYDTHVSARHAWEQVGLRRVRTGWTMLRSLDDSIADPQPVEGVMLRTYRRPDDNLPTLHALNNSFVDVFDFQPLTEERWRHAMDASYVRPDLSWVAEPEAEQGNIIGFSICWITDEENERSGRLEGWIEGLGVVREWRKAGLGRALLLNSLHSLKTAGMEAALADVDSENAQATSLFQSAGFGVRNMLSQYECYLDEVVVA